MRRKRLLPKPLPPPEGFMYLHSDTFKILEIEQIAYEEMFIHDRSTPKKRRMNWGEDYNLREQRKDLK